MSSNILIWNVAATDGSDVSDGFQRFLMVPYWYWWLPVVSDVSKWKLKAPYGLRCSKWTLMALNGFWWLQMDIDGSQWFQMDNDGSLWFIMIKNRYWWIPMVSYGSKWIMAPNCLWWLYMDIDGSEWLLMAPNGYWWLPYGLQLFWMVIDGSK